LSERKLESIALGHGERELERIDRIEAEIAAEQRSVPDRSPQA